MTKDELKARLTQDEDGFLERKESAHHSDVKESLVSFANAVPLGREAVVLIGQRPDKKIVGVPNADKLQRDVRDWARQCYPPVSAGLEIIPTEQGQVVAIVIPHSTKRPHFTGKAYKRVGSQNVEASEEMLDEMIASRNETAGRLLAHKGEIISVDFESRLLGSRSSIVTRPDECRIESASAHSVELRSVSS